MKVGDIVERDGTKRLVTNVYTLCGGIAYDSVPAEDAKVKRSGKKSVDNVPADETVIPENTPAE